MARFALFLAAACFSLTQAAPAKTNCMVTITDSNGAGGGACSAANGDGGILMPNGGPNVLYNLDKNCKLTITNGPFNGITGTASIVDGSC
ncbi:uncharacterized protein CTRU02_213787 [Colletotrichum truncatum]|uniref:Uncharacterized protein n=1 Tax=Colletotrichum truncatum TaxID=5467 RepID=A0ACC3YIS3_COLTU|nr:uncharacterized protein CTRU02_12807 [Colletotrichum truncatum]KAF6784040.1 hypothetical protein CTRU02_12807 [Colletotrichum truncatum]